MDALAPHRRCSPPLLLPHSVGCAREILLQKMTDGVAVQEEEEVIDEGVEGYAPGLRGCSSTVTLSGIQIQNIAIN